MAYNEGLAQQIRLALQTQSGVVEKKMFGGIAFMLHGNLACGIQQDEMIVRVGPEAYDEALTLPYTRPFDFTGRPMKGWVMVEATGCEDDANLKSWVEQGVAFALSLPPK